MTTDRQLADLVYRQSFGAFVHEAVRALDGKRGVQPNWHIDMVCYHLQRMFKRELDHRLVLNQPPRSLKSIIVSVCLPAWALGHDPALSVIAASYSDELARKFSRDCRTLMESSFYKRIFPGTRLSPRKTSEVEFETTCNGGRYATSVGGTLTGRGADLFIVDDPLKAIEANSETARSHVNNWFNGSAFSRLNEPGRSLMIVTMQRLHADDLSGMLIERGWPCLVLPAIATQSNTYQLNDRVTYLRQPGMFLQPDRDRADDLDGIKQQLGSAAFAAQYQQDPTPSDGNIIERDWLARYAAKSALPKFHRVVMSCDPAGKPGPNNDHTALIVAGLSADSVHVLHASRGHWSPVQTKLRITDLAASYGCNIVMIEDTAGGMGLIQDLRTQSKLSILARRPKGDKVSRLHSVLGMFEAGQIILPDEAPWLADFEKELLGFPGARYDDQLDALVMLLEWFRNSVPAPMVFAGPIIITRPRHVLDQWSW